MKGKRNILIILLILLCFSTACEVEGGRRSTSSNDISISDNSNIISSSSISIDPIISSMAQENGLPYSSQEFINAVNNINVDLNAGAAISNAFALFEALEEWDYSEVLEAYDRLCQYEEQYSLLVSKQEKINLFLEKIEVLNREITLDDEYHIVRAEDSYAKLDDELKNDPSVIEGYEKLVQIRITFENLVEQTRIELELKAAQDFVDYVNPLLNKESYEYYDYFSYLDALEQYRRLSDNAKTFEDVINSYNLLLELKETIGVKEAKDYYKVELYHKNNDWEHVLRFKPNNDNALFTSDNALIDFSVVRDGGSIVRETTYVTRNGYPSGVAAINAYPYYDATTGYYVIGFSIHETPVSDYTYEVTFGVEADNGQYYYFHLYYKAEQNSVAIGYDEESIKRDFYSQKIVDVYLEYDKDEYDEENYQKLTQIYNEGLLAFETCDNPYLHYLEIISNMDSVYKVFPSIETMSIKEVSSKETQINNIIDNNKGSRWQAETNAKGEYVIIDLGQEYSIGRILIMWEGANAAEYEVQYSIDGESWSDLIKFKDPTVGVHKRDDSLLFETVEARYVKIIMNVPGSGYGYSIYEIDVFQNLMSKE